MQVRYFKYSVFLLAFCFSIIFESALFRIISQAAIIPSFHLIIIHYFSVRNYSKLILFLSFICGLVVDILFYNYLGLSSLMFVVFSRLISVNKYSILAQSFSDMFFYFFISISLFNICKSLILFQLFNQPIQIEDLLLHITTTLMVYPLSYMILRRIKV